MVGTNPSHETTANTHTASEAPITAMTAPAAITTSTKAPRERSSAFHVAINGSLRINDKHRITNIPIDSTTKRHNEGPVSDAA